MSDTLNFTSPFFSFHGRVGSNSTQIVLSMHLPVVNTRDISGITSLLNRHLPTIFQTKCFNPQHWSFKDEVKATEIGHLFEHIILEYLCLSKEVHCPSAFSFSAHTDWDWKIEPKGTFRISIDAGLSDLPHIRLAVIRATGLLKTILSQRQVTFPSYLSSAMALNP